MPLWLEYHPLVASYARGDSGPELATKYGLPIPQHAPAIHVKLRRLSRVLGPAR
jgi:hypothetical protein